MGQNKPSRFFGLTNGHEPEICHPIKQSRISPKNFQNLAKNRSRKLLSTVKINKNCLNSSLKWAWKVGYNIQFGPQCGPGSWVSRWPGWELVLGFLGLDWLASCLVLVGPDLKERWDLITRIDLSIGLAHQPKQSFIFLSSFREESKRILRTLQQNTLYLAH